MPIYAYKCESCGHAKDVLQKMSDPVMTVCPSCGKSTFAKQVTAAGFQLKGSGWYVTDFRGGGNAAESAKPDAGNAAASGGPDASTKTESTGASAQSSGAATGGSSPSPAAAAAATPPAKGATPSGSGV
jgi:putative FmdB family regulatory protein